MQPVPNRGPFGETLDALLRSLLCRPTPCSREHTSATVESLNALFFPLEQRETSVRHIGVSPCRKLMSLVRNCTLRIDYCRIRPLARQKGQHVAQKNNAPIALRASS